MSVLLLDAEIFCAVSVVQSLGRRGIAVDVASADRDCLAFHSRHARKCLVQPMCPANAEFVDWLRRLDAAGSYHLVLPINEGSLAAIAELPDHDSLRQKAQLPFREAIFTALHKEKTRVLARECGIRTPETHYLTQDTFAESGSTTGKYPLVLKPSTSRTWIEDRPTTLRVKLVHNPEERIEALKTMLRHTPVLQQEFIPGSGYGIELLYRNGRMLWHFAHERIHELPLTGGASTYRRSLAAPPAMLAAAKTLLDKLNWHGWAMVEFRGDPQTFHLMEINPRVWGSISLSIKSGVDFPYAMYQLACGQSPGPQPPYRTGYFARSVLRDLEWFAANLKADHQNPILLTRPRLRSTGELFRPLIGKESWDDFDWTDLGITARTVCLAFATLFRKLLRPGKKPERL